MYQVEVFVTYKESILDPQGEAVKNAVHRLEFNEVADVRIGKYFELKIEKSQRPVAEIVEELCQQLLANEVLESYRYDIKEVN
ncbi:phosphoribosylformylglycinamidine synthase subunit PurS [Vagococcus sp. BWB3-3]|uniref:Phosphoribosylformylglycinamidine synthase subunit PurS n=1 Tax=Vagococcus allomyrinae TaxID=2794353 RepID=A0A940PII8_9ENTE|nr:phosphoribosylformylglycinamidine synthase subunit PurS [Vagococcus allomyrinae]MBP1043538.1 phosphoribosylformylglycinamidine synthase subunit PurS [Vagococcus allomyrinae]